ncbi:MAG: hypothetical protein PUF12_11520 [Thermoflexaceae bacterium]|nr:hypothetical protein [Thermoflexaceae bacterium]
MKKKIIVKSISLFLVIIMIIAPVVFSHDRQTNYQEKTEMTYVQEERLAGIQSSEKQGSSGQDEKKVETVYVKADADGRVNEVKVSEWLKHAQTGETIEDVSILKNIKNVEGDEEYTGKAGNVILWENHGENISYEGTTDKELPVSVRIHYYLEGKEISPEEIAGKSGNIKIRFEYENHTAQKVMVNGKEVETVVPFIMVTLLYLPSDIFFNVEAVNGKVMESEEQAIVAGFAFPGLEESLHLAEYEVTEAIDLPEYFEITAYVENFELEFTATIASCGLLNDLDTNDLDDIEEMIDDMGKMEDAVDELLDGTKEMSDGVTKIKNYVNQYMEGVGAVDEGVGKLKDAMAVLNGQSEKLETGAKSINEGLSSLNTLLKQISLSDDAVPPAGADGNMAGSSKSQIEALSGAAVKLMQDSALLSQELNQLETALNDMNAFVSDARTYQIQVTEKITAVRGKLDEIDFSGVNDTARNQAKEAVAAALAEAGTALTDEQLEAIQAKADEKIDTVDFTASLTSQMAALDEIKTDLSTMPVLAIPDIAIDGAAIFTVIEDMQVQLSIIKGSAAGLGEMTQKLAGLETSLESLKTGIGQLTEGSKALSDGITAYADGVAKIYEGVEELKKGTGELASVGGEFNEGFDALIEGVEAMRDGVFEFKEEGIKSLTDFAGEDLRTVVQALRAAKILNDGYDNFAGIKEGIEGSVVFLIETETIKP